LKDWTAQISLKGHAKFDFSRTRVWEMEEGPSGIYATAGFEGSRTAIATGKVN
jgi:hypothetical protein